MTPLHYSSLPFKCSSSLSFLAPSFAAMPLPTLHCLAPHPRSLLPSPVLHLPHVIFSCSVLSLHALFYSISPCPVLPRPSPSNTCLSTLRSVPPMSPPPSSFCSFPIPYAPPWPSSPCPSPTWPSPPWPFPPWLSPPYTSTHRKWFHASVLRNNQTAGNASARGAY